MRESVAEPGIKQEACRALLASPQAHTGVLLFSKLSLCHNACCASAAPLLAACLQLASRIWPRVNNNKNTLVICTTVVPKKNPNYL